MAVTILPLANQVIRQFADFPDVDMRFANKAAFETAIVNQARIPDGWMAYCTTEKKWYYADKVNGIAIEFGSGSGGSSTFEDLTDSPYDNELLADALNRIEGKADIAQEDIDELELIVSGKLTGTLAADADLQTQTTPTEDNKFVSRHGLIFFWNWLRTQAVEFTNSVRIAGLGIGISRNVASFLNIAVNTASLGQILLPPSSLDYTGTLAGMVWNNAMEFKFYDNTISSVNRFVKTQGNELFKASAGTTRIAEFNDAGDLIGVTEVREAIVFDTDLQTAIETATYTAGRATISVSGKTVYTGQRHYDDDYSYLAIADNLIERSQGV